MSFDPANAHTGLGLTEAEADALYLPLALKEWDAVVRKAGDETLQSSTTLQDDAELLIPVAGGLACYFQLVLAYQSDATADFKCDFALSTGAATRSWRQFLGLGPTTLIIQAGQVADLSTAVVLAGDSPTTTPLAALIVGYVMPSLSANLVFRWAQNTSQALNCTVKAGSYIAYRSLD